MLTKNTSAASSTTASTPSERCTELERKVVHLSVAIEDRSASIDLLTEAIQDAEKASENEHKHQNAELRVKYEEASNQYLTQLEKLKTDCSESIEMKKILAAEFEEMVELKKKEEEKMTSRLDEIRRRMEEKILEEKNKWMAGKIKREREWMANKVKQVRKATLEALQPELKRLLDRQKLEIEEMKEEKDSKVKYLQLEAQRNHEVKLSDHNSETVTRTRIAAARRKENWMEQIAQTRQSFAKEVQELVTSNEGPWSEAAIMKEHSENVKLLEEKHCRNMERITEARDRRKKEIQTTLQQQLKDLENDSVELLKKVDDEHTEKKNSWKKKREAEMQKEFEDSMKVVPDGLKKERDRRRIDIEIRSCQKEETQFEQGFATDAVNQKKDLEMEFTNQLQAIEILLLILYLAC
jgi:hypothetical protein